MTKTRIIVVVCFCLAFAAGGAAGFAFSRFVLRPERRSHLADELNLTSEQSEKMRKIWSEVMGKLRQRRREKREAIRKERDEAVQNLLSEEQKEKYEEIMKRYAAQSESLSKEGKQAFEEAVSRTKELLTEPQRRKYEEMLKQRAEGRRRGGRHSRWRRSSGDGAERGPEKGAEAPSQQK